MFGNNDQQAQATGGGNGFSADNFTPPGSTSPMTFDTTSAVTTDTTAAPANNDNTTVTAPSVPAELLETPALPTAGTPDPVATDSSSSDASQAPSSDSDNELLNLKQQALHELSPLVNQLDQTPEEKFRTMMMMIQASDDQTLLKAAYDAAQAISDEKQRAQALLDVVNEINYFTQHSQN